MPLHGVRLLKRRFCGASQPENNNKKPQWLLRGLRSYPGVFLPNGVMVPAPVAVAIGTAAHISRQQQLPGWAGGERPRTGAVEGTPPRRHLVKTALALAAFHNNLT